MGSYFLALAAGVLSTINPCVLPLLPIIVGGALSKSRFGPLAMASGLIISFTVIGLFTIWVGASLGIAQESLRMVGATLLVIFGLILIFQRLQQTFSKLTAPIALSSDKLLSHGFFIRPIGLFFAGMLMGAVWSPCSGPTLGAAIGLASQQEKVIQGALHMIVFGLGASLPLLVIGYGGRSFVIKIRGKLIKSSQYGKIIIGSIFLVIGLLVLTGYDRQVETWILDQMPSWLVALMVAI